MGDVIDLTNEDVAAPSNAGAGPSKPSAGASNSNLSPMCPICYNTYETIQTKGRFLLALKTCGHTICSHCAVTVIKGANVKCHMCKRQSDRVAGQHTARVFLSFGE